MSYVVPLTKADLTITNVQVRFRALSRHEATCKGCLRKRLMCSKRLGVCQVCFHAAVLKAKHPPSDEEDLRALWGADA